ncbi:CAP-Gly domain-containing linker protein 4-like isoform X2 [Oncorhynchus masou masou]|uniref:CAP-Gly domain-containing linker protein 4-like isoform X2 n=1 Tax=Oncorhynchus masou masou TaxID=90313 RepID=UPI0031838FD2
MIVGGENEGSLHGNRYFRCKPNHGTFTTITGIRKLSRSSHSKSRSSKPPEEGDSSDSGPGSSAVAIGRSSQSVGSKNGLRRTWNQMDIRAQVHSEPGGPRDKTTVENPGLD